VKIAMLLLAAGRGTRFGGPIPKAWLELGGKALVVHAAERLLKAAPAGATTELLVVVHPDDRRSALPAVEGRLRALAPEPGRLRIVDGGSTRQGSVQNGLAACSPDVDLVLVHDAARALLPIAATRDCIAAAARHGAALLAVPIADTMKRVVGERVAGTVEREHMWAAQTPQIVQAALLRRAFAHAAATGFVGTDDVSLVEHLGAPVVVVPGAPTNMKITRPDDLPLAAAILAANLTR